MSSSAGRIRGGYDERSHLVGEAAYQGRLGATRLEPVHVLLDDGRVRTVTIHVGVNIGSDPHLKEAALAGALHRFEGGEELAVPYVLHDPVARKLAVVVPEVLRHRALEEHGKLLSAIASDRDVPVPAYALEAKVVVGPAGLRAYLEKPDGKAALDALGGERDLLEAQRTALDMERGGLERDRQELARHREGLERDRAELERQRHTLGQEAQGRVVAAGQLEAERQALAQLRGEIERERATLEQREQRVRERAEAVTTREDEIREELEKQEAQSRDLSMREQELEQRLEALVQREQALREREVKRVEERGADRPKSVPPEAPKKGFKPTLTPPTSPIAQPIEGEDALSLESVEEIDELEPIRTSPGRRAGEGDLDAEDAVEEIVDDEDVAEEVDPDALEIGVREETTGVHGQGDDREASGPRTAIADLRTIAGASSVPPPGPRMPAELEQAEMIAEASDGVDLFVRLPEGVDGLGELDLLVRLSAEDGPAAVLELIGRGPAGLVSRRAALDLRSSDERSVLDLLRRRFEAQVHFFAHDGRVFDEARVTAPREVNAARVVDRGVRLKSDASSAALKQRAAARAAPSEPHPFGVEEPAETSAAAVLATLGPLADALAPERLDHALTVLSVPRDQIDQAVTRAIERAVGHGLALPTALAERALASAIVPDAAALVVRQIDAFRGTVLRPDRGQLDEAQIATNWERLLKAAADNEVALDSETHDLAFRAIRAHKGDDTGGHAAEVDVSNLGELAPPQLVMLLEHPRHRRAAAIALADKKDASFADVLCKAVRKMPRAEVVRVMPKLVALGEEAGDALIDGLSARKTFVRQGFALVLGHLKLRRAVVPILHRLIAEDSDVAKELARILGGFGNAAFRPFARQLGDAKTDDARLVLTLSHLALAGCEKQVNELKKDSDPRTRDLAQRAIAALNEARAQDEIVKGTRPLESGDPILAFSRRFEDELKGTAPEADLAGDD